MMTDDILGIVFILVIIAGLLGLGWVAKRYGGC